MRVGITGANGFIGNHLARHVVRVGHDLIVFLQNGTSDSLLKPLAPKVFWGDVTVLESLTPFLKECDVLFHLAGYNRYWSRNPRVFHDVNCTGARNIAAGCRAHGISKLVHVSSCVTLGASAKPMPRNEESDFNLHGVRFLYAETKKVGEQDMKHRARNEGLPVVIVNPASAIGEMDFGPTPIGKPIVDICKGYWPVYVAGGACFIDVHDLVHGLWLALERGRTGEQYLLAGDNLSNKEFMTMVADLAGAPRPKMRIPRFALTIAAHLGEWLADHVTHQHPPLTVGMNALIGKYLYFDGTKARTELGFSPGPCKGAVARAIRWFRENGYV